MGLKLIAITGVAGSGKDIFSDRLVDAHGFIKLPFAAPLKDACGPLFDWPVGMLHTNDFKQFMDPRWGLHVREVYQRVGDAMKREFGEDFWVRNWTHRFGEVMSKFSVVVPDLRSETEAKVIRDLGGLVVHLHRIGAGLQGKLGEHSSEKGIEFHPKDVTAANNDGIIHLWGMADTSVAFIHYNSKRLRYRNEVPE